MLTDFLDGRGANLITAILIVAVALLALVVVFWLMRGRSNATFIRGGKNRRPRLAVLDATAVDTRRRLVLVRRDDVEHLILIGGPTDVVVESRIAVETQSIPDRAAEAKAPTVLATPVAPPAPPTPPTPVSAPASQPNREAEAAADRAPPHMDRGDTGPHPVSPPPAPRERSASPPASVRQPAPVPPPSPVVARGGLGGQSIEPARGQQAAMPFAPVAQPSRGPAARPTASAPAVAARTAVAGAAMTIATPRAPDDLPKRAIEVDAPTIEATRDGPAPAIAPSREPTLAFGGDTDALLDSLDSARHRVLGQAPSTTEAPPAETKQRAASGHAETLSADFGSDAEATRRANVAAEASAPTGGYEPPAYATFEGPDAADGLAADGASEAALAARYAPDALAAGADFEAVLEAEMEAARAIPVAVVRNPAEDVAIPPVSAVAHATPKITQIPVVEIDHHASGRDRPVTRPGGPAAAEPMLEPEIRPAEATGRRPSLDEEMEKLLGELAPRR